MFLKKSEQKKSSSCVILAVGALAAIGFMTVTGKGKNMIKSIKNKMRSMFMGEGCSCPIQYEE